MEKPVVVYKQLGISFWKEVVTLFGEVILFCFGGPVNSLVSFKIFLVADNSSQF